MMFERPQGTSAGYALAAIRLGATYDPAELSRLKVEGITPDAVEARWRHERARTRLPTLTFALSLDRALNGLTRPFFGWISDHIGRENTMLVAFLLEGLAVYGLLSFAHEPFLFVPAHEATRRRGPNNVRAWRSGGASPFLLNQSLAQSPRYLRISCSTSPCCCHTHCKQSRGWQAVGHRSAAYRGMTMLKLFITAGLLCAASLASAQTVGLSGHEIRNLIAGAAVEIDTPLGTKLPIRYAADGRLFGQAHDLASYLGAPVDTGRWWINSDQLCHKWHRWFGSEPQCMRLSKQGRTIHWLNQDGNNGTAVITEPAPVATAATDRKMHVAAPQSGPTIDDAAEPRVHAPQPLYPANQPLVAPLSGEAEIVRQGTAPSNLPALQQTREPKRPAAPLFMVANVEADDVLNVRSGPSTDFDIIAELEPGSRGVAITGACRSQWCPVQHASTKGWVNRTYLTDDDAMSSTRPQSIDDMLTGNGTAHTRPAELRDSTDAPRSCLTPPARALLERIEATFGPVKLISTCRPGAIIAATGRPSKHASGDAIDFDAGNRKGQIVEWLIANHRDGGTMTYPDMDHIHVDIGPHFVSVAGGRHWASWRDNR
jgi:Bacterial SH3 domain